MFIVRISVSKRITIYLLLVLIATVTAGVKQVGLKRQINKTDLNLRYHLHSVKGICANAWISNNKYFYKPVIMFP